MRPRRCRLPIAAMYSRRARSSKKGPPRHSSTALTSSVLTWASNPPYLPESQKLKRTALAWLVLVGLALAGCTIGVSTPPKSMGLIKLGADLPLTGDDAPDGIPAKNAIDLAIKQAGRVCGASPHQDACFDLQ